MQLAISQSRKEDQLKKETERQSIKMRSNTGILENKFHNLVHLTPNLTDGITDDKLKFNYVFPNKIRDVYESKQGMKFSTPRYPMSPP